MAWDVYLMGWGHSNGGRDKHVISVYVTAGNDSPGVIAKEDKFHASFNSEDEARREAQRLRAQFGYS